MTRRYDPPLRKKFAGSLAGFTLYTINAFAVRNAARQDEEFTNFATYHDFPDAIPTDEIWLARQSFPREGQFFVANAIAQLQAEAKGASEETAATIGAKVERRLRKRVLGIPYRAGRPHRHIPGKLYVQPYLQIPDEKFPVDVWIVDGCLVRSMYKTDYTEGGHGYVYPWCPRHEIWIEEDLDRAERPYILAHEYTELRLMRDQQLDYDTAHAICVRVEFDLRKGPRRARFPGLSHHQLTKRDFAKLARPEYFEFVKKQYV
jgi:hypothetical protein